MRKPNIVFLDAASVGNADLSSLAKLGRLEVFDRTEPHQLLERAKGAEIVITNKVKLMKPELDALPELKLICIAATGTNNVDLAEASLKGISVKNVADYSTNSVAQLTIAFALNLIHHLSYYDAFVKRGAYSQSGLFTNHERPFFELNGKKWGIVGMGNIGKRVASIVQALGAEVVYYSTSGNNLDAGYAHANLHELLATCHVVSIHAPLNEKTQNLLDYEAICRMKSSGLLINVGRGGIVNEEGLAQALREHRLAGAAVDVFTGEPLATNNPLLASDIADKLLLTPHLAWASAEARARLIAVIEGHIREYYIPR